MNKGILAVVTLMVIISAGIFVFQPERIDNEMSHNEEEEHGHDELGMDMSMEMMASMNVSNDREFIDGMIPHHQEAIDTANEVLERGGKIESIKTLAQNIIGAQAKEIADMKVWYKDWFGEEYQDKGMYMKMMRDLSQYSGRELDLIFTEDMIFHHKGAIMMAHLALEFSEREEMIALSNNIVKTQQEEIEFMESVIAQ
jgi:uncharacterized protein (DUF305 family)